MNIEVQSCADVGVAKEDTDGLVVTFALDATGSKTMAEAVETHLGKA